MVTPSHTRSHQRPTHPPVALKGSEASGDWHEPSGFAQAARREPARSDKRRLKRPAYIGRRSAHVMALTDAAYRTCQWAKRMVGAPNWDKYSGELVMCATLGLEGGPSEISERVCLWREKYDGKHFTLTMNQLRTDGYATDKVAWLPPKTIVTSIMPSGGREHHTVLRRKGWDPAATEWDLPEGQARATVPVRIRPAASFQDGAKKHAVAAAVYEEVVVTMDRVPELINRCWKRRVRREAKGGRVRGSKSAGTLYAVLPGCRISLRPVSERPTGREVRVGTHAEFVNLGDVDVDKAGASASGLEVVADVNLDELAEAGGVMSAFEESGGWEEVEGGKGKGWSRLFGVDLDLGGVGLEGGREQVAGAFARFLKRQGGGIPDALTRGGRCSGVSVAVEGRRWVVTGK